MAQQATKQPGSINHQTALIYTMVLVSAADRDMTDAELSMIGQEVQKLPVFRDYDAADLPAEAAKCAEYLSQDDGLDTLLGLIATALPGMLKETAYALACDIAVADGKPSQEEIRLLEMLRHALKLDPLAAAAIERAARARNATL